MRNNDCGYFTYFVHHCVHDCNSYSNGLAKRESSTPNSHHSVNNPVVNDALLLFPDNTVEKPRLELLR